MSCRPISMHDFRHWIQLTFSTLPTRANSVWYDGDCIRKLNSCMKYCAERSEFPPLKKNIPPADMLSRAKFRTFSSLLSFSENCVTMIFVRILFLKRTFWSDKRIDKITKIMHKTPFQMTIWKDHKNQRAIWSMFLLKKVLASPGSYLLSQAVAKSWNTVHYGESPLS